MSPTIENGGLTRYTKPDGQVVVLGPAARRSSDTGDVTIKNPDGSIGTVVMPAMGNSLGLRQRTIGPSGEISTATQSDYARRADRNAMTQEGTVRQMKLDQYIADREQRRQDALDLRRRANAMRGYGQTGGLTMAAYGPMGQPIPMTQPIFGQTGPSLAAAAGMVNAYDTMVDDQAASQEAERQNALALMDAENRNKLAQIEAQTTANIRERQALPGMTEGMAEQDKLVAEQARAEASNIAATPAEQLEVDQYIKRQEAPPVDMANPTSRVEFVHFVLTDPSLSKEAKQKLIRGGAGVVSRKAFEDLWNQSSYDRAGWWNRDRLGGWIGGNNMEPIDAWDAVFGNSW